MKYGMKMKGNHKPAKECSVLKSPQSIVYVSESDACFHFCPSFWNLVHWISTECANS